MENSHFITNQWRFLYNHQDIIYFKSESGTVEPTSGLVNKNASEQIFPSIRRMQQLWINKITHLINVECTTNFDDMRLRSRQRLKAKTFVFWLT
uniref:Nitrite reductase n=1 Tax=Ascaris lumbricoides TaxID=6252 RepID=A0A0M3HLK0_ASCLU